MKHKIRCVVKSSERDVFNARVRRSLMFWIYHVMFVLRSIVASLTMQIYTNNRPTGIQA